MNGSPTKTEMVDSAGGRSQISQLTAGAIVLVVLLFLTGPLAYLPNAVLAAVVFLIGIRLVDVKGMADIARLRPGEFVVALITAAVVVVVGVEQGIILAMALSVIEHIDHSYHPYDALLARTPKGHLAVAPLEQRTQAAPGLAIYRFGAGLYYANASRFTEEILELAEGADPPLRWLAVSGAAIGDIDFSGADTAPAPEGRAGTTGRDPGPLRHQPARPRGTRRLRADGRHRRRPDLPNRGRRDRGVPHRSVRNVGDRCPGAAATDAGAQREITRGGMGANEVIDWSNAARIALLVPGDSQVDDEFWRLLAPHGIPCVSRTTGADQLLMGTVGMAAAHTAALAASSDLEVAADRLRAARPVAAAYVDTSISFVRGPEGAADITRRVQGFLNVPTVVTSTAVVDAAHALGVGSVAVVSVYLDEINATMPAFFDPQGVRIARIGPLTDHVMTSSESSTDLAHVSPDDLVAAGRDLDGPDVDAIFIPCTAVRTLDAIEPLEAAIGKPVITAIHATMWRVARLAGLTHDAPGGGRLFELA